MLNCLQLFMLPFAGGNSTSFRRLLPFLDSRISAYTVEYSGRMSRRDESYINGYDDFLLDVSHQINVHREMSIPFAVFGYSLGAIIAYDLLADCMIKGLPLHAFICAKGSPFQKPGRYDFDDNSEDSFIEEIVKLGGVDERILTDKRFLDAYMGPIKADYIVWSNYRYKGGHIPCDVTAIYSDRDEASFGVHDWSLVSDKNIDYYQMGKNHFFIYENWEKVADIVNSHLIRYF